MSLYSDLKAAGCKLDSHESDLYVKASPEACRIVRAAKSNVWSHFRSQIDEELWIEVPFAFAPWWEKRLGKGVCV